MKLGIQNERVYKKNRNKITAMAIPQSSFQLPLWPDYPVSIAMPLEFVINSLQAIGCHNAYHSMVN
ncbi:MAG: hypothetical protein ABI361_14240 [Nitrososphaera sp.]